MSQKQIALTMVLAGALAGKDYKYGKFEFSQGRIRLVGSVADVEAEKHYLEASLNIHVEGQAPEQVPEPPKLPEGNPGAQPQGDAKLAAVLAQLDPDNDDHWTQQGKPALAAVEAAYGSSAITRADVEAAAPGLTREAAKAAKAK